MSAYARMNVATAHLPSVRIRVDVGSPIQKSAHVEMEIPYVRTRRSTQPVPNEARRRQPFTSVRPASRQHGEVEAASSRLLPFSTDSPLAT